MTDLLREHLKKFKKFDDMDSIVAAMEVRAEDRAEYTPEGLVEMLKHPARYEDGTFNHLVIYPALLEEIATRPAPKDACTGEEALPLLRTWAATTEAGQKQRALYALVRILGPECDEAVEALESNDAASEVAVLCALTDPAFGGARPDGQLSERIAKHIERLAREGLSSGAERENQYGSPMSIADWRFFERPLVLAAMRLSDPKKAIAAMLENSALCGQLLNALAETDGDVDMADTFVPRFERAVEIIERSYEEHGVAKLDEVGVISAIASLVGENAIFGDHAARIVHLLPGFAPPLVKKPLRGRTPNKALRAILDLLERSAHLLSLESLRLVAAHLNGEFEEVFVTAGHAWAHLPLEEARAITAEFDKGKPSHRELRWDAAAAGFAALPEPRADLGDLFAEHVDAHNLTDALRTALASIPMDTTKLESLIDKARTAEELRAAIQTAVDQRATAVLRKILVKFRDGPFRIDEATEALLPPLIDDDNIDWLEAEIEDENPFRDRREALQRALSAKRS